MLSYEPNIKNGIYIEVPDYSTTCTNILLVMNSGHWTALPDPQELDYEEYDLDSEAGSGRSQDGFMHRDRVAVKQKLIIKTPYMFAKDWAIMKRLISAQSFQVMYFDVSSGDWVEKDMYVGDRKMPVYGLWDHEHPEMSLLKPCSFNLIER